MGEKTSEKVAPFVKVHLSEFDFAVKDVSTALKAIFDKHRDKEEEAKVVFHITEAEDVDKLFLLMDEMERYINRGSDVPEYIVRDLPKEGSVHFADGATLFWPNSWVTKIKLASSMKEDIHSFLEKVYSLPNVEDLELSMQRNNLPILRNSVVKLKKLKSLSVLYSNQNSLPPILRFCDEIEKIDLRYNEFRYLPFWITKMKKLEKLRRFGNPLFFEVKPYTLIDKCVVRNFRIQVQNFNNKEKKVLNKPSPLLLLAASAVLVEFPRLLLLHGENNVEIPRTIFDDLVSIVPAIKFCDNCNRAFFHCEYPVLRKTFRDFKGYKNIPFEAACCSEVCANELFKQWVEVARIEESIEDDIVPFDIAGSSEAVQHPFDNRQRFLCGKRLTNVLWGAFCWCCCGNVGF